MNRTTLLQDRRMQKFCDVLSLSTAGNDDQARALTAGG